MPACQSAMRQIAWLLLAILTQLVLTTTRASQNSSPSQSLDAVEKCASVQLAFEEVESNACRCFSTGYRGDRTGDASWIGCTRQELRPIFTALSAFENITTISKLWLWDCSLPTLAASLFDKIRPITLKIEDSSVRRFDKNVFKALGERLENLELKRNSIIQMDGRTFENLPQLRHLDLTGNEIDLLDERSFGRHDRMETLLLQRSKIQRIADGTFQYLSALKHLNLANNNLSEIGQKTFLGLTNLEVLSLENNQISKIEPGAFAHLKKLKVLNLGNNLLTALDLSATPHLEKLFLQRNAFQGLSDIYYGDTVLSKLHTFTMDKNNLQKIGATDLNNFPQLKSFSAAFNKINFIHPSALRYNSDLSTLSLQGNNLTTIDDHLLLPVLGLENLFLTDNRLTKLGERTLYGLRLLKVLSLAKNQIKEIDKRAFAGLFSLEKLYINDNKLETLSNDTLLYIDRTLLNVDLSGNPWFCNCSLSWLASWVEEHKNSVVGASYTTCSTIPMSFKKLSENNILAIKEKQKRDKDNDSALQKLQLQGDIKGTQMVENDEVTIDCVTLPPPTAGLGEYAQALNVICADENTSKSLDEDWDPGHSIWITIMALALAIISMLILAAIAVLYMQEFKRAATLDLLARNYDLRRVPSDMVNLINPGGGFVGPAGHGTQQQAAQAGVHAGQQKQGNMETDGHRVLKPIPEDNENTLADEGVSQKEKKHVTFAPQNNS